MAVDGVAPRAKMNQQRSRRFRTAAEAKELRDKALAKGEELPDSDPFDSNCITPGTVFMAKLSEQLKYFVSKKVNEDSDWRSVQVVLSGHEVPGEGEHKIMEYIRLAKAQPDYNPNMRHCLYGLDADLIMLGLLSHDPHFCLLREEVVFGPQRKKSKGTLESQNFYLMHLSLFREYLDLEFSSIADTPDLGFEYDLERIIDDWILLVIFVGNDFLPHLPGLHINEGALNMLYQIYKRVLPKAGGYLNEHGKLNTKRLQMILDELRTHEQNVFEQEYADSNWFKGKQTKHIEALEQARHRAKLALTTDQRQLFNKIKAFVASAVANPAAAGTLFFPAKYPARDRRFLQDIASDLRLSIAFDEFNERDEPVIAIRLEDEVVDMLADSLADDVDGLTIDGENGDGSEWKEAIDRVLQKYEKAPTLPEHNEIDFEKEYQAKLKQKMDAWKEEYYHEKMNINYNDPAEMHKIVYRYVEGLQWVLHYYYDGVAAWGWFYDYHYAPKISDLQGVGDFEFQFEFGQPFKPFEQLMGVLPDLSAKLIPPAYRDLMSDPASPIIDFYPRNFAMDMNGKKQEWEAVVKIPFIDQDRLLKTMKEREVKLTADERQRNSWGNSWKCYYSDQEDETYPSSLPGFFPDLLHCHAIIEPFDLPTLSGLKLVKGLCEGVLLGKDAIAGFPSLYTLATSGSLGYQSVNVFQQDSKNESMVITVDASPLTRPDGTIKMEDVASVLLGQRIYVNWPFLKEALVVALSDELFRYEYDAEATGRKSLKSTPHKPDEVVTWRRKTDRLETTYAKRYGTIIGSVDIIVHVKVLKGMKLLEDGALVKDFGSAESDQALQTIVQSVSSADTRFEEKAAPPIEVDFPVGTRVFFLGTEPVYGCASQVIGHTGKTVRLMTAFHPDDASEPFKFKTVLQHGPSANYLPSYSVCRRVQMSALALSKITSSLLIFLPGEGKVNAGLNLKFEAKGLKVLGYTRKSDYGWEFSDKAIDLILQYRTAFPEIIHALDARKGSDVRDMRDFFPNADPDAKAKEIKQWLKDKGVDSFERVALDAEQLESDTVKLLENKADQLVQARKPAAMKRAVINNIPRRALLRPEHAANRLSGQSFKLGDRVLMVSEAGNVPLTAKGTVVGLQGVSSQGQLASKGLIDVVWDVAFISGTTLQNRCSEYRGLSVPPDSVLNLTVPQFVARVGPPSQAATAPDGNNARGRGAPRGRGFFTPAPERGRGATNYRRASSNPRGGHNGQQFTGNYTAAAHNAPGAFTTPQPAQAMSQTQLLHQTLINAGRGPRGNYHAVPPPPSLQHAPNRGPTQRSRGYANGERGASLSRGGPPQRGHGRGRGRGRGAPAGDSNS